ncbi:MAG: ATP-dependent RNA helicase HrpA [Pseudomonadota bacterium]
MTKPERQNPPSDPAASDTAGASAALDLSGVMNRDVPELQRRVRLIARRRREGKPVDRAVAALEAMAAESRAARESRDAAALRVEFDPQLPISGHIDEICRQLQNHQVLVVAGETGSGKTTQLPKACWLAGRGRVGWIGCTQPRRIAARSIAARLAEELNVTVGEAVGYQVRFDQQVGTDSLIKVMTDGILLSETERDRQLMAYDTLIIDEAHERSLNIDFLLGYLKRLLPKRPDLKLIITSATIDTARFSAHFDDAPVIEVSGRSYPVEMRYRPLLDESGESISLPDAIVQAVAELSQVDPRGDALVFLSGERDIREAADALSKAQLRNTEILPLYARLSRKDQQKIFRPGAARRIVLSTNVAETSLTVPRIRFVIDTGLARISRYSQRSKVQRLPIEPISQASANQRSGRCGRLGPGVCIRLFAEDDFDARERYTQPEILRTNLASVILQMELLKLGQVEDYPFLDPPSAAFIRDGYHLLTELNAIDAGQKLTALGRKMARWPLDVRLARLVLAGEKLGCLDDAMVLAAFLSLPDPRERPLDAQQAADQQQARWQDTQSDFGGVLRLWQEWLGVRADQSQRQQRSWARDHFLSYLRLREWHDLTRQLADVAGVSKPGRLAPPEGTEREVAAAEKERSDRVHKALLSAFLGHVGVKDEKGYLGARDRRYDIFPGSGLFKRGPRWMVSAFLVETTRLYARLNASVEPAWIEQAGAHLIKRRFFDPYWSRRQGRVLGYEQVSLYGLVLVGKRRVHFGPHETAEAHRVFLLEALARGELNTRGKFAEANRRLLAQLESLEQRMRRADLRVDDEALAEVFGARVPGHIHSAKQFEKWRGEAEQADPRCLFLAEADVSTSQPVPLADDWPDSLELAGASFPLKYRFDPAADDDGVTLELPLALVNLPAAEPLEWLVPGYLADKVTALLKSLPKALRRRVVPAPDYARKFLESPTDEDRHGSLRTALATFLTRETGQEFSAAQFDEANLEPWLRMNVRLLDGKEVLDEGRSLSAITRRWEEQGREQFLRLSEATLRHDGAREWRFGSIPETTELPGDITAYPALVDQGDAVGVRVFDGEVEAREHHRYGLRRLLVLSLADRFKYLGRHLALTPENYLQYAGVGSAKELEHDILYAVSMALVDEGEAPPRSEAAFETLAARARSQVVRAGTELSTLVAEVLKRFHQIRHQLNDELEKISPSAVADVHQQLEYLIYPGFLTEVTYGRLTHYPRYLDGISLRLERLEKDPLKDRRHLSQISGFWDDYIQRCAIEDGYPAALDEFHWLLEEYRISLFSQPLKTAQPVSAKRLKSAWTKVLAPA